MAYPWTLTFVYVLAFYGFILLAFSKRGSETIREALYYYPCLASFLPAYLATAYLFYCHKTGGIELMPAIKTVAYLAVPCLVLLKAIRQDKVNLWDWLAIALLWVPFDLRLLGRRNGAVRDALDWPLTAVSAVVIGLVFWVGWRKIDGTKTCLKLRLKDLMVVLAGLLALMLMLLPLGFVIGFLHPRPLWYDGRAWGEIIFVHLFSWKFLGYLAKIYGTIALSEEFLFRGIIQNFLDKYWGQGWRSWLLTSILFGTAHLNNGAKSIMLMDWNWNYFVMATLAGMAYGMVFRQTSSLLYPMLLHALVDAIWHTFFS